MMTLEMFEKNMNDERVEAFFHALDIKIYDAWTLFRLLGEDTSQPIDLDVFIGGCLQLKGPATAINLQELAKEVHWIGKHIDKRFNQLTNSRPTQLTNLQATSKRSDSQAAIRSSQLAN